MTTKTENTSAFAVVDPDDANDHYADSDVPGEFRSLTTALGCDQLAVTLIRVPPRSHRNEGDDPVEIWALSRQLGRSDSTKLDDLWDASPDASQRAT